MVLDLRWRVRVVIFISSQCIVFTGPCQALSYFIYSLLFYSHSHVAFPTTATTLIYLTYAQHMLVFICIPVKSGLLSFRPTLVIYVKVLCSRPVLMITFALHPRCFGHIHPVVPNCCRVFQSHFPHPHPSDSHPRCFQFPSTTALQESSVPVSPLWPVRCIF